MSSQLFFLHIPRTMGTALKDQCLWPNYEPKSTMILDLNWHSALSNTPERYKDVKLICSHLGINIQSVTNRPAQIFTMLRDPIYRARSMYYFCKRVDWHYQHVPARHMDLAEFATDPETNVVIRNSYARYLISDIGYRQLAEMVHGTPTRGKLDEAFFKLNLDVPEDELLDRAKEKLQQLFFVGISDEFYKSVQLLWDYLGFSDRPEPPKLGPDIGRQMHPYLRSNIYPLRTPEYEAVAAINQVDVRLYRLAKERTELEWRGSL